MRQIFGSPYRNLFAAGLVVFLVTAFFSEGYFHPDEHFQVLEFAHYKLGRAAAADLPWEFDARIRPALQPAIVYVIIRAATALGIYDPFVYTLLLRLLTALLAWFVIAKICLLCAPRSTTRTTQRLFVACSFFLWFVPSISVRFSSENYSSLTLLAALYLLLRSNERDRKPRWSEVAGAGILLALSFYFRFQVGFAILGLALWLLFIRRLAWKYLLCLAAVGLFTAALCTSIDYWFYGEWVCTPLRYFQSNIVDNKAANWGVEPWWYYITQFFLQGIPLVSLPLIVLFLAGIYAQPRSLFTWCIVPFIVAHMAVGHKELRFLFPVVFPFIVLAAAGLDRLLKTYGHRRAWRITILVATVANMPLLAFKMLTPAQEVVPYYRYLYRNLEPGTPLFTIEKDPYEILDLRVNFYRPAGLQTVVLADRQQLANHLESARPPSLLLLERQMATDTFPRYTSESVYSVVPPWVLRFNINNWVGRSRIWNIREFRRKEP